MNQILAIDNSSKKGKKNREPADIKSICKFFAIVIMIFGIFLIASSSYGMYKDGQVKEEKHTKPTIVLDTKSEDTILLRIMHDKEIEKAGYYWNDEEPEIIQGRGRTYIEQEITIPGGENTLHVSVIDIEGQTNYIDKPYETKDVINLEIEQGSGKLKITADNETEISYMTYRWEDEEETKIDINDTKINTEIDIPKGQNTLTIVLVDVNNKTITKKQEVKGVVKPTIEVSVDNAKENFVIKATDENEIQKIEFIITNSELTNKKFRVRAQTEGQKEIVYKYPLTKGENRITITAYNTDDVASETLKRKATIGD